MIDEESTLEDVCFEVAGALERASLHGVLTGGSAATIYAPEAYASYDADFVLEENPGRRTLGDALNDAGFVPIPSSRIFRHARSKYTVDFPKGPLAVGGDYVDETATLERGDARLRILTPTDCVRDRLAHFYYWNDYTALATAVAVARAHRDRVDFERIGRWTERGDDDLRKKYREFLDRL